MPTVPPAAYILLSLFCLRRGYFALRRDTLLPMAAKGCKNAAKDPWSLDFPLFPCDHAAKRPTRNCLRVPSPLPLPRPALIVRCSKNSGPAGRTYTCRRWRQVRDLIIAKIGRPTNVLCPPRQRQRGQTHGRFPAEPFSAASKSAQRKSKNHWFLAAFFSPFLPLLEEMGPPEAKARKK